MFTSSCERRRREGVRSKRKGKGKEKREGGKEGEDCFDIKFRWPFMLIPYFLCSLHGSNPLLLTSAVNIKQRTVNSITQPGQTKVSSIF